jgi:hypothetical protein
MLHWVKEITKEPSTGPALKRMNPMIHGEMKR